MRTSGYHSRPRATIKPKMYADYLQEKKLSLKASQASAWRNGETITTPLLTKNERR